MRFTTRELFLLTLIVALCLGWGLDHWRLAGMCADWQMYWSIGREREEELRESLRKAEEKLADPTSQSH